MHAALISALVLACACLKAVSSVAPTPPPRETDTTWLDGFVPPPGHEYAMEEGAHERLMVFAQGEAFGLPQMRGALAAMFEPADPRWRYPAREALRAAGGRAEAALVECLRDRRYAPPAQPSDPHPWDFACERLARSGCRALVGILLDAARDGVVPPQRERDCALWIAAVGAPESVAPTLAALQDPEPYVRSYARSGVAWALSGGHLGPEMREAIFGPLLESALAAPTHLNGVEEVWVLIRLDRARAIAALASDDVLNLNHPRLAHVLQAFTAPPPPHVLAPGERYDLVAAPPARLWRLWRSLEESGFEQSRMALAWPVLGALAVSDPERLRPIAEELFTRGGRLQAPAMSALTILENFPLGSEALALWKDRSPAERAPLPILHADAVEHCLLYNTLGGISYHFETYEDWRLAPDGFRTIGLTACADAVETAASIYFGAGGPPPDLRARERIIADHEETDREERVLSDCGKTLEDAGEEIQRRLFLYMRQHRELFASLKPRPVVTRP